MKQKYIVLVCLVGLTFGLSGQDIVPSIFSNISFQGKDGFAFTQGEQTYVNTFEPTAYTLANVTGNPEGTATGFDFDFNLQTLNGTLYFGLIDYNGGKYHQPVFFKRPATIREGRASINMNQLKGKYDMTHWEQHKRGDLAYRVVSSDGLILYDGKIAFEYNTVFKCLPTITEGPLLSMMTDTSVVIKFQTNRDALCKVNIGKNEYKELIPSTNHEIKIQDLSPETKYQYSIVCAENHYDYHFTTSPRNGTRKPFTFAYASDSRSGKGGGERHIFGTNAYILKKAIALASQQNAVFMQFTGDMINGYSANVQKTLLQYANFKNVVSPFTAYMPLYLGIGNHEVMERNFYKGDERVSIARFPFDTESTEALFAESFAHHTNGPESEDGSDCDPNPNKVDFPSYQENVYYYTYGNIAVIVLNTEYIYTPSLSRYPKTSGGLHGYMMDKQLEWLGSVLNKFENDRNIDHIFVTHHTPVFPNGGHVGDAMWYGGDNNYRTIIAGKGLKRGILEQRDMYLDLIINQSTKVRVLLTGDEHNYAKTHISDEMPRYPANWDKPKLKLKRSIYQINNGACGAPYYAQEKAPWSDFVSGFSTQNALVLIDVNGKKLSVRVLNPDTLEEIERYSLND